MAGQKIPLTFGVELEFAAACLYEGEPHLFPSEKRRVRFGPRGGEPSIAQVKETYARDWARHPRWEMELYRNFFQRDLRELLQLHEFPVYMELNPREKYKKWQVKEDITVSGPPCGYHWLNIEVVSPVLPFNQKSLDDVQKVCDLIQMYYCVHTDSSTGLHVHVGRGDHAFESEHIRRLAAFNYAFQPQLASIIGQTRWETAEYAEDIRTRSRYAIKHYQKYGRRPAPIAAVRHFLESKEFRDASGPRSRRSESVKEWIVNQASGDEPKYSHLNLGNVALLDQGAEGYIPTVEWRLHPGTVTAERVTTWIKTVCGIVDFVCYGYPQDIYNLLSVVEHEHWEKTGNAAEDAKNLQRYGPILAESDFTAVDLFEAMGLKDSAAYYADKLTVINVKEDKLATNARGRRVKGHVIWEPNEPGLSPGEAEDIAARKRLFLDLWEAGLNRNTTPEFDPDDPFWPKFHLRHRRSLDTNSDASTVDLPIT